MAQKISEAGKNIDLEQRKFLREKEIEQIFGINRNTLRRQRWGIMEFLIQ